jgi:hypothetical protein
MLSMRGGGGGGVLHPHCIPSPALYDRHQPILYCWRGGRAEFSTPIYPFSGTILSMRGIIVSSWIMAKSNFVSYKILIFKHIECKNSKKFKIGAKQNSKVCVPLIVNDNRQLFLGMFYKLSLPHSAEGLPIRYVVGLG